jgi:exodeoxyribonuclease V gamma subunit
VNETRFHLWQGENLDVLAARFTELLRESPRRDPFAEETVVVPNRSLALWLSLQVAERNVICPSIRYPFPGAFLYKAVFNPMAAATHRHPPEPDDLPFAPSETRWQILRILTGWPAEDPVFERVRTFTGGDPSRCYQLACRMANLYDRYMTYRPAMLDAWERGNDSAAEGEDAPWQAALWRALIRANGDEPRHFSGLYAEFMRFARQGRTDFLHRLRRQGRVFYFGVSALPPAHVDILVQLAALGVADIHFFALNPCHEMWSDAKNRKAELRDQLALTEKLGFEAARPYFVGSHPLLGSLGRSGRDFFSLLATYDGIAEEPFLEGPSFSSGTVLSTLQREIHANTADASPEPLRAGDDSVTFHSCHSPRREVEALRDQLLALFAAMPGLMPRDIRIYAPDIAAYAPYIDAVFRPASPDDSRAIPYTIADKTVSREYSECQAFLQLLAAVTGRFKASDVLGLLNLPALQTSAGLANEEMPTVSRLLSESRVTWGLNAGFRADQGSAPDYIHTWRFAVDSLLLAIAMRGDAFHPAEVRLAAGEYAVALADNPQPDPGLVSRIAEFLRRLSDFHEACLGAPSHTCAEWHGILLRAVTAFFGQGDPDAPYGVLALRQALETFRASIVGSGCENLSVPFSVLRSWLVENVADAPGHEGYVSEGVTFSRFQPMRNVPARVVIMLGMNDGALPRPAHPLSFDLMDPRTDFRIGDRSPRDDDRYAFLETFLAARERLLIFFTGKSELTNKPLPPSVLVSELRDAIDRRFAVPSGSASETLTVSHPLHPFSPAYFEPGRDPRLVSFSPADREVAGRIANPSSQVQSLTVQKFPHPGLPSARGTLSLEDLIRFFRSPCQDYFQNRLGIALRLRAEPPPPDEDPLVASELDLYVLTSEWLSLLLRDPKADFDSFKAHILRSGRFPVFDNKDFDSCRSQVAALLDARKESGFDGSPLPPEERTFDCGGRRLSAVFASCYDGQRQFFMRPARQKGKDRLKARIYHLARCASGESVSTTWLGFEKNRNGVFTPKLCNDAPVPAETACETLSRLIDIAENPELQPVCFQPETAWLIAGRARSRDIEKSWTDADDPALHECFGPSLPDSTSDGGKVLYELSSFLYGVDAKQ